MNAVALISGAALCVGAYAFHWRARLLGDQSHGWPAAPLVIRIALDAAAITLLLAGTWQISTGKIPAGLQAALSVVLASYAVVFAVNIGRQRQPATEPPKTFAVSGEVTATPEPK